MQKKVHPRSEPFLRHKRINLFSEPAVVLIPPYTDPLADSPVEIVVQTTKPPTESPVFVAMGVPMVLPIATFCGSPLPQLNKAPSPKLLAAPLSNGLTMGTNSNGEEDDGGALPRANATTKRLTAMAH